MNSHDSLWQHIPDAAKHALDYVSIGVVFGTLVNILPSLAALLSIVWSAVRIYESKTFGRLIGRKPQDSE